MALIGNWGKIWPRNGSHYGNGRAKMSKNFPTHLNTKTQRGGGKIFARLSKNNHSGEQFRNKNPRQKLRPREGLERMGYRVQGGRCPLRFRGPNVGGWNVRKIPVKHPKNIGQKSEKYRNHQKYNMLFLKNTLFLGE